MGKGTIIDEFDNGLYTITLDVGTIEKQARVENLTTQIEGETLNLANKVAEVDAQEDVVADAEAALESAISDLVFLQNKEITGQPVSQDAITAAKQLVDQLTKALQLESSKLAQLNSSVDFLTAAIQTLTDQKEKTEDLITAQFLEAQCIDGETGLTGDVGTIEVDGDRNRGVLIKAGYESAAYSVATDGKIVLSDLQSGAQAYLNTALFPAWQRHSPTYRVGVISNIDKNADTCSVLLDSDTSAAQNLPINESPSLTGVPVEYRECNSLAFTDGDRVVVKFEGQNKEAPKVVGFEVNPRPCLTYVNWSCSVNRRGSSGRYLDIAVVSYDEETQQTQTWYQYFDNLTYAQTHYYPMVVGQDGDLYLSRFGYDSSNYPRNVYFKWGGSFEYWLTTEEYIACPYPNPVYVNTSTDGKRIYCSDYEEQRYVYGYLMDQGGVTGGVFDVQTTPPVNKLARGICYGISQDFNGVIVAKFYDGTLSGVNRDYYYVLDRDDPSIVYAEIAGSDSGWTYQIGLCGKGILHANSDSSNYYLDKYAPTSANWDEVQEWISDGIISLSGSSSQLGTSVNGVYYVTESSPSGNAGVAFQPYSGGSKTIIVANAGLEGFFDSNQSALKRRPAE